jgi:cell division protease FtsH
MRKWFKDPKNRPMLWLAVAGLVFTGFVVSMQAQAANSTTTYSVASTIDGTNVDLADQVYLVTRANITPVEWKPAKEEVKNGFVPVEVLGTSEFLHRIKDLPTTQIKVASLNSDTGTAAFAVDKSATSKTIYVATILESQVESVITALDTAGTPLTVVRATADPVAVLSESGTMVAPASTAGASRTGWGNTASTAPKIAAGATSPYVKAVNTEVRLVEARQNAAGAAASSSTTGTIFSFFILLVLGGLFIRLLVRMGKGGFGGASLGSSKADKTSDDSIPDTRFSDIAGCDEAIEEMAEVVEFLKDPDKFTRLGAKPPRGALLVGPPGTGKTLLARAVAGESGVPFYAVAGSDFTEMYVGVGAKRVRELFEKARKHENGAIIFIDEIDAVGRKRSSGAVSGGTSETENTLNAMLVEMDGFEKSKIVVMGATNRDDLLDTALTRPGRLDRKITVALPDRAGRERILEVHSRAKPLAKGVDLSLMARRTPGMSGAELAQLINEACMTAARLGADEVTDEHFDSALATVAMGRARTSAVVTEHDRLVTAWHEAGHTVAAMVLPDADEPVSVSIIPRGPAGGVTWMAQGDDLFLTRRRAFARLVVAMGGRSAEEILLDGEFTSGPHGDLSAATQTAMAMVTQYGMTDAGLMIRSEGLLSTGSKVTDATVEAVEALLSDALETARATLANHYDLLKAIVEALLEHDTLTLSQLNALRDGVKLSAPVLPPAPTSYRKTPSVDEPRRPVERVRFDAPERRRVLKLGPLSVELPTKKRRKSSS